MNNTPKYHLADVPQDLRTRALDLCFRRLFDDAVDLLVTHGFTTYNRDDLINFYNWAPATLPNQGPAHSDTVVKTPRDYPQPSPDLIADIRSRLADIPPNVLERVDHALKHEPIQHAGTLLWKAGVCLSSADLYEYRKTLFPPNGLMDAYTQDTPVLRPEPAEPIPQPQAQASTPIPTETIVPLLPIVPIPPANRESLTTQTIPSLQPSMNASISDSTNPLPPAPSISLPKNPSIQESSDPSSMPLAPTIPNDPSLGNAPSPQIQSSIHPAIPGLPVPRKRRGKIASLPKEIRDELNTRLEANQSYNTISRWLAHAGHPGFNKQNLHLWKNGGYHDWRRENERIQTQILQREWLNEQVAQTKPGELFLLIDQLFVTQLLDSLFGLDTAAMKQGLTNPRHYISMFSAYNRFKRHAMNSDEFRAFLQRQRELEALKNPGKVGLSDEGLHAIELAYNIRGRDPEPEPEPPSKIVKDSQT